MNADGSETTELHRYAGFLETIPDAAVLVDAGGVIQHANSRVRLLFAYDPGELHGRPVHMLLPTRLQERHVGHVRGFLEDPSITPMGRDVDLLARRSDGDEIPIDIMLSPVELDGQPLTLAVVRDMSAREALRRRLAAALTGERRLARTDHLTGAANKRSFEDALDLEIERCRRYGSPFTVLYADLDNFKEVNDSLGHNEGDEVIRTLVEAATSELRRSDVVARVGGDEFAFLLLETDAEAATAAARKLHRVLVDRMQARGWPVTLSMGAVTCLETPDSSSQVLEAADALMYEVKRAGKNAVRHGVLPGPSAR